MRHHAPYFELCDNASDAAAFAIGLDESGEGVAVAVQFPDRSIVKVEDWPEIGDEMERQRLLREAWAEEHKGDPIPKTRQVRSAIGDGLVWADEDDPDWIGLPS